MKVLQENQGKLSLRLAGISADRMDFQALTSQAININRFYLSEEVLELLLLLALAKIYWNSARKEDLFLRLSLFGQLEKW